MSRGFGKTQRACIRVLRGEGRSLGTKELVQMVFDTESPSKSQYTSVHQALSRLEGSGQVIRDRAYHWGDVTMWALKREGD